MLSGKLRSKRGISLPVAMAITAVLAILSASLIAIALNSITNTSSSVNYRQAYLNAKSALEYAKSYYSDTTNVPDLTKITEEEYMVMNDKDGGTTAQGASFVTSEDKTKDSLTYVVAKYVKKEGSTDPGGLRIVAYATSTDAFGKKSQTVTLGAWFSINKKGGKNRLVIPNVNLNTYMSDDYIPPDTIQLHCKLYPGEIWTPFFYTWTYNDVERMYDLSNSCYGLEAGYKDYTHNTNRKYKVARLDANGEPVKDANGEIIYDERSIPNGYNTNQSSRNKFEPSGPWNALSDSNLQAGPSSYFSPKDGSWYEATYYINDEQVKYFNMIISQKGCTLNGPNGEWRPNSQTCEMFHLWYLNHNDPNIYFEFLKPCLQKNPDGKDIPNLGYVPGAEWNGSDSLQDRILVYVKNKKTTIHFKVKGVGDGEDGLITPANSPKINSVRIVGTSIFDEDSSYADYSQAANTNYYNPSSMDDKALSLIDKGRDDAKKYFYGTDDNNRAFLQYEGQGWWVANIATGKKFELMLTYYDENGDDTTFRVPVEPSTQDEAYVVADMSKNEIVSRREELDACRRIGLDINSYTTVRVKSSEIGMAVAPYLNYESEGVSSTVKRNLLDLIIKCQQYKSDNYEETAYTAFQTSLSDATTTYNTSTSTEAEIKAKYDDLTAKLADLEKHPKKPGLEVIRMFNAKIKQCDDLVTEQGNNIIYSSSAFSVFTAETGAYKKNKAISESSEFVDNADENGLPIYTTTKIYEMIQEIDDALAVLEEKRLDKDALKELLDTSKPYKEDKRYDDSKNAESFMAAFRNAWSYANDAYYKGAAGVGSSETDEKVITDAKNDLQAAFDALLEHPLNNLDTSEIIPLIRQAEKLYNDNINCTDATKKVLNKALTAAKNSYKAPDATQGKVDAAKDALKEAIAQFTVAKPNNTIEKAASEGKVRIFVKGLNEGTQYYSYKDGNGNVQQNKNSFEVTSFYMTTYKNGASTGHTYSSKASTNKAHFTAVAGTDYCYIDLPYSSSSEKFSAVVFDVYTTENELGRWNASTGKYNIVSSVSKEFSNLEPVSVGNVNNGVVFDLTYLIKGTRTTTTSSGSKDVEYTDLEFNRNKLSTLYINAPYGVTATVTNPDGTIVDYSAIEENVVVPTGVGDETTTVKYQVIRFPFTPAVTKKDSNGNVVSKTTQKIQLNVNDTSNSEVITTDKVDTKIGEQIVTIGNKKAANRLQITYPSTTTLARNGLEETGIMFGNETKFTAASLSGTSYVFDGTYDTKYTTFKIYRKVKDGYKAIHPLVDKYYEDDNGDYGLDANGTYYNISNRYRMSTDNNNGRFTGTKYKAVYTYTQSDNGTYFLDTDGEYKLIADHYSNAQPFSSYNLRRYNKNGNYSYSRDYSGTGLYFRNGSSYYLISDYYYDGQGYSNTISSYTEDENGEYFKYGSRYYKISDYYFTGQAYSIRQEEDPTSIDLVKVDGTYVDISNELEIKGSGEINVRFTRNGADLTETATAEYTEKTYYTMDTTWTAMNLVYPKYTSSISSSGSGATADVMSELVSSSFSDSLLTAPVTASAGEVTTASAKFDYFGQSNIDDAPPTKNWGQTVLWIDTNNNYLKEFRTDTPPTMLVYAWDDNELDINGAWPGNPAIRLEDSNIYYVVVSSTCRGCIISRKVLNTDAEYNKASINDVDGRTTNVEQVKYADGRVAPFKIIRRGGDPYHDHNVYLDLSDMQEWRGNQILYNWAICKHGVHQGHCCLYSKIDGDVLSGADIASNRFTSTYRNGVGYTYIDCIVPAPGKNGNSTDKNHINTSITDVKSNGTVMTNNFYCKGIPGFEFDESAYEKYWTNGNDKKYYYPGDGWYERKAIKTSATLSVNSTTSSAVPIYGSSVNEYAYVTFSDTFVHNGSTRTDTKCYARAVYCANMRYKYRVKREDKPQPYTYTKSAVNHDDIDHKDLRMAFIGGNKIRIENASYYETYGELQYTGHQTITSDFYSEENGGSKNGKTNIQLHNLYGGAGGNKGSMGRVGDSNLLSIYDWFEYKIPVDHDDKYTFELYGLRYDSTTVAGKEWYEKDYKTDTSFYTAQVNGAIGNIWVVMQDIVPEGGLLKHMKVYTNDPDIVDYADEQQLFFDQPAEIIASGVGGSETYTTTQYADDLNLQTVTIPAEKPFLTITTGGRTFRTSLQGGDYIRFIDKGNGSFYWDNYVPVSTYKKRALYTLQAMYYGNTIPIEYDDKGVIVKKSQGTTSLLYPNGIFENVLKNKFSNNGQYGGYLEDGWESTDYNTLTEYQTYYSGLYSGIVSARNYLTPADVTLGNNELKYIEFYNDGGHKYEEDKTLAKTGNYPEYLTHDHANNIYSDESLTNLKNAYSQAIKTYINSNSISEIREAAEKLDDAINGLTLNTDDKLMLIFYNTNPRDYEITSLKLHYDYPASKDVDGETVEDPNSLSTKEPMEVTFETTEGYPIAFVPIEDYVSNIYNVWFEIDTYDENNYPVTIQGKKDKIPALDGAYVYMFQPGYGDDPDDPDYKPDSSQWLQNTAADYREINVEAFNQGSDDQKMLYEMVPLRKSRTAAIEVAENAEKASGLDYRPQTLYFAKNTQVNCKDSSKSYVIKAGAYSFQKVENDTSEGFVKSLNPDDSEIYKDGKQPNLQGPYSYQFVDDKTGWRPCLNLYSDEAKAYFTNPAHYGEFTEEARNAKDIQGWVSDGSIVTGDHMSSSNTNLSVSTGSFSGNSVSYSSHKNLYFRWESNNPLYVHTDTSLNVDIESDEDDDDDDSSTKKQAELHFACPGVIDATQNYNTHFYLGSFSDQLDSITVDFLTDVNIQYLDDDGEIQKFVIREGSYIISRPEGREGYIADLCDIEYWTSMTYVTFNARYDSENGDYDAQNSTNTRFSEPIYF